MLHENITRLDDGTYRQSWQMLNRYGYFMQVGVAQICVMGDYGFLVVIKQEARLW